MRKLFACLLSIVLLSGGVTPAAVSAQNEPDETADPAVQETKNNTGEEMTEETDTMSLVLPEETEVTQEASEETPEIEETGTLNAPEENPAEETEDPETEEEPTVFHDESVYINPIYEGLISEAALVFEEPEDVLTDDELTGDLLGAANYFYTDFDQAAEGLRNAILQHAFTVDLYFIFPESCESDINSNILPEKALAGLNDYYRAAVYGTRMRLSYSYTGAGTIKGVLSYTLSYFTTAAQEAAFDTKVKQVVDSLNLYDKSEYEKIKAIYTYICSNVVYDHANLDDETYLLKYSAYAALINGTSVCQGYAALFQRMATLAGLNARYITGTAIGAEEGRHGWNAVMIEDRYYLLDSTWDSNYGSSFSQYEWFLKGTDNFPRHTEGTAYDSSYSPTDYDPDSGFPFPVISVRVIPAEDSLFVGDTMALRTVITPSSAMDKRLTFTSSDPSVASVDQLGNVTGISPGTVTITVTSASDMTGTAEIEVIERDYVNVDSYEFDDFNFQSQPFLIPFQSPEPASRKIAYTVSPSNATDQTMIWVSEDESIVTVDDNGTVTGLKPGSTYVLVTPHGITNEDEGTRTVNVQVVGVDFGADSIHLEAGESHSFASVTMFPDNSFEARYWDSSDESVATVDTDGTVHALKTGTCVITASTGYGTFIDNTITVTVGYPVESVTLDQTSLSMVKGERTKLTATITPANATNKAVTWTSSNTGVATVDTSGNVTAKGAGSAVITVTTKDGNKKAACRVTVTVPVTGVTLNNTGLSLEKGKTATLTATVSPADASNKKVTWTSSDPAVATVDSNGKVTAKGVGQAVITVTTADGGFTASCTVNVKVFVTGIELDHSSLVLMKGDSTALTASISPSDASNKKVTWTSSNPNAATVDSSGTVTAKGSGTAVITVKTADGGKTATCSVAVAEPEEYIPVESVGWAPGYPASVDMAAGMVLEINPVIKPDNATIRDYTVTSSNPKAVRITDTNDAEALSAGTATITVTTVDGEKRASLDVTVFPAPEKITLDVTSLTLKPNEETTLKTTIAPADADNYLISCSWKSSNSQVATVSNDGKVTAVSAGTAEITVTVNLGNRKATCKVTVAVPVTSVTLNKTSLSLEKGKTASLTATVSPADASNKKVTWTSSNTRIAAVDTSGKVTAKAAGTATITVTTADGSKKATCKVTVKETKPTPTPTATPKPTAKPTPVPTKDPAACRTFGFCTYNGKEYWYENGVRQAVPGDPKNLIDEEYHVERGREIFDPATGAWYWLDSVYDGAKAVGKEVWMPYIYQEEKNWINDAEKLNEIVEAVNSYSEDGGPLSDMGEQVRQMILSGKGKWVRYDENGKMMKGWVTIDTPELIALYPAQKGFTYFYDYTTGLMAKGWTTIGGTRYFFDKITGVLRQ